LVNILQEKLVEFLKSVNHIYGHDFVHYNYSTLKRRIENHCIKLHIDSFDEYCKLILNYKKHFDCMFQYFSINVTEFFREPEQLKLFKEKVIPYLKSFPHIKIWCAGCSSGESPYALSIILDEAGILNRSQIYATDFWLFLRTSSSLYLFVGHCLQGYDHKRKILIDILYKYRYQILNYA